VRESKREHSTELIGLAMSVFEDISPVAEVEDRPDELLDDYCESKTSDVVNLLVCFVFVIVKCRMTNVFCGPILGHVYLCDYSEFMLSRWHHPHL
jgi:hypothetical protein